MMIKVLVMTLMTTFGFGSRIGITADALRGTGFSLIDERLTALVTMPIVLRSAPSIVFCPGYDGCEVGGDVVNLAFVKGDMCS